jgi:hypothetical protein
VLVTANTNISKKPLFREPAPVSISKASSHVHPSCCPQ